ncbi:MAG TPA: SIR2 family protein [bacterium]|nr:SIR2 family protein [bacterium]
MDEQVGFKTQGHSAGRFREWYTSDNPLIDFVLSHESNKEWTWKYVPNEARAIFNDLKEFMLTRLATVDSDQARNMFLEFLHLLLDDESRAYCFSLNYDLVLEDALNGSQWVLERGFDHTGRWRGLDLNGSGRPKLILGKMHGSLDWTLDEHRQPIATATKGRVPPETLVVYPVATKQWYRQPFFSLISSFSDRLMESDVLIIVGCSLRDEAIVSVVSDACNRNKSLRLIVVSPRMSDLEVRQQLSLAAQTIVRLINTRWLGPETVAALSAQIETA